MKIKLGRILKILSTVLIAVGIAYLFLFVREQNSSVLDIFDRPSYYAAQNYRLLFLAGIASVAFSVLGSFFSWSDKIDPKEEVLMNAGYTSAQNIATWLKDSTANEESRQFTVSTAAGTEVSGATTVIDSAPASNETTVMQESHETVTAVQPERPAAADSAPAAKETTIMQADFEDEWAADTELTNPGSGKEKNS
ncbi:MAG: hypothetical protein K6G61_05380 [Solobacterium sp.]|nr:hypothetical protein [Solobacterium sp.]